MTQSESNVPQSLCPARLAKSLSMTRIRESSVCLQANSEGPHSIFVSFSENSFISFNAHCPILAQHQHIHANTETRAWTQTPRLRFGLLIHKVFSRAVICPIGLSLNVFEWDQTTVIVNASRYNGPNEKEYSWFTPKLLSCGLLVIQMVLPLLFYRNPLYLSGCCIHLVSPFFSINHGIFEIVRNLGSFGWRYTEPDTVF